MSVDGIIASDVHIREDRPYCRVDNYQATQWDKIAQIMQIQAQFKIPVFYGGDVFNACKSSPELLAKAMRRMPTGYMVPGQHDLPNHNMNLMYKSNLEVMMAHGTMECVCSKGVMVTYAEYAGITRPYAVYGLPWRYLEEHDEVTPESFPMQYQIGSEPPSRKVLILHKFVYEGALPWPGCEECQPEDFFKKIKGFDLIVTGDHHTPIVAESGDGVILCNPGPLMRMKANEADYKPRVYLWDAEANQVKPHFLTIDAEAVSREHLDTQKEKDQRMNAFIDSLQEDLELSLDFRENMHKEIRESKISEPVTQLIHRSMEERIK